LRQHHDLKKLFGIQLQQILDKCINFCAFTDLLFLFAFGVKNRQLDFCRLVGDPVTTFFC